MASWTIENIKNSKVAGNNRGITGEVTKQTAQERYQALGRMKAGKMNKTEAAYCQVLEMEKQFGKILHYWFEPFNLRIGENCFYKCDFLVLKADHHLELREIKGHLTDDALVKMRAVASMYPFRLVMLRLVKGEWIEREF